MELMEYTATDMVKMKIKLNLGTRYVNASIGLFDVKGLTGSNPSLGLVTPLFDKITIHLNKEYYRGKKFVITKTGNTGCDAYVNQYLLNERPLQNIYFFFLRKL